MLELRPILAFSALTGFIVFILYRGISYEAHTFAPSSSTSQETLGQHGLPDFGNYRDIAILSAEEFPLDDSSRRVIIVGDIHGMNDRLHALLDKLSYDKASDSLIHAGDILAKGPHKGSLAVLSYMSSHNITGVRGNHDQKVIEWRGWIDWIRAQPGGRKWLDELEENYQDNAEGKKLTEWVESAKKKDESKWWDKIPEGWKLFSDHYNIARDMSETDYAYLKNLPLKIHVPSAHAFIVHAGLLPSDPNYKPTNPRQPLARIPDLRKDMLSHKYAALREVQERTILTEVPQNTDPWTNINMRSVRDNGEATKSSDDGTPWSDLWNRDMKSCRGYVTNAVKPKDSLPCMPSTVVYGHAASRGLDVKRWSIGLDSGCVYGRELTALVLSSKDKKFYEDDVEDDAEDGENEDGADENDETEDDDEDDKRQRDLTARRKKGRNWVRFGDRGRGKLVSVKCY
ncbi:Metallo-dependent phosphatase-like protein [Schizophyllum amplum]|uniref:Metallo-dependent phosphatase-like protein n=1 Tax=Schizophyllum amplum TaxID=97359 RepID=A0A550CJ00_9AGAR|nr:Metallo-dependent phosphatase-like protein [Auriculariopsis ampla]